MEGKSAKGVQLSMPNSQSKFVVCNNGITVQTLIYDIVYVHMYVVK
jgi:hypothetical protein